MALTQTSGGRPTSLVVLAGSPLDGPELVADATEFSKQRRSFGCGDGPRGLDNPVVISAGVLSQAGVAQAIAPEDVRWDFGEEGEQIAAVRAPAANDYKGGCVRHKAPFGQPNVAFSKGVQSPYSALEFSSSSASTWPSPTNSLVLPSSASINNSQSSKRGAASGETSRRPITWLLWPS